MDKATVKQFLKINNLRPIKKLGQNFLINKNLCQKMVQEVKKQQAPFVEIGPGLGALTLFFESQKKDLLLVEKDKKLAQLWSHKAWNVVCGDALKLCWDKWPKHFTLFSNLPYEIAASLIIKASLRKKQVPVMILSMQKEVAERLMAKAKSKNYGLLSVMAQSFWRLRVLAKLLKTDFYPIPQVDGKMLELKAKKQEDLEPEGFLKFLKSCFAFKRKMLFKKLPLKSPEEAKKRLEKLAFRPDSRAEDLTAPQFAQLYLNLTKKP